MTIFDRVNYWVRNSETSLVNLLSAIAPWAAPLAPAFMSYYHMTNAMEFPSYIALAVAAVVEILGLSAISTILAFWSYNRRRVAEYRKAPVFLAVFSFVFYLTVVLVINVLLDAAAIPSSGMSQEWVVVLARALLTLLSVPAAIILATRTQHKEMLDQAERERNERSQARQQPARHKVPVVAVQSGEAHSRRKRAFLQDYHSGALQEKLVSEGLEFNAINIAQLYGTSERTVYRWMVNLKETNNG